MMNKLSETVRPSLLTENNRQQLFKFVILNVPLSGLREVAGGRQAEL